jgi:hypothetical protein
MSKSNGDKKSDTMSKTIFAAISAFTILAGISPTLAANAPGAPFTTVNDGPEKFIRTRLGVEALVEAVRANDEASLDAMLGAEGKVLLGDRAAFLAQYDAYHEINRFSPRQVELIIGADRQVMPIPLVKRDWTGWYFDAERGKAEWLLQRMARNEPLTPIIR